MSGLIELIPIICIPIFFCMPENSIRFINRFSAQIEWLGVQYEMRSDKFL